MRKDILTQRLNRLNKEKDELRAQGLASDNVDAVKAAYARMEQLNADIAETQAELDAIAEEERSVAPSDAQKVNAQILGVTR